MEARLALSSAAVFCLLLGLIAGMHLGGQWERQQWQRTQRLPPVVRLRDPKLVLRVPVLTTAYSSTPDQTDSSPFVTASGQRVGPGTLAVSDDLRCWLPWGTKVRINGTTFRVEDAMASYWHRKVDVWMANRGAALRWGVRQVVLEVGE